MGFVFRHTRVVIRFQICIFDILNTAYILANRTNICCDSLSNLYLWHIKYSVEYFNIKCCRVVIRFQICIFDILNTAVILTKIEATSCDSLSNLYLWHIKYSEEWENLKKDGVVIRFQICIFDILNTASRCSARTRRQLWFAFKFVSLTY